MTDPAHSLFVIARSAATRQSHPHPHRTHRREASPDASVLDSFRTKHGGIWGCLPTSARADPFTLRRGRRPGGPLYDPLPRQTGRFVNRPCEQAPTFTVAQDKEKPPPSPGEIYPFCLVEAASLTVQRTAV